MEPPEIRHQFCADDGTVVTIRPIRPSDAEIEQNFVRLLSTRSKRLRFLGAVKELASKMLSRFVHVDYPRDLALIATVMNGEVEHEIGVARYAQGSEEGVAEFAIVVADDWQGRGVGSELLRHLFDIASDVGLDRMEGIVLRENDGMLRLAKAFGFRVESYPDDAALIRVHKDFH